MCFHALMRYKFTFLYLFVILMETVLFKHWPLMIDITDTMQFTPWTIVTGTWFVLRDYSQREVGHYVFIPMILGILTGALFISPEIALAVVLAGGASELTDWAVYTLSKKPFHKRILISSLLATPLDTLIFFSAFDYLDIIPGASIFNWPSVIVGTLSKMIAALVIYHHYNRREQLRVNVA